MNTRPVFLLSLSAALLLAGAGCATTQYSNSPSTYDQGGGAGMTTNILSPKAGQTFPAGQDIAIKAGAMDMSGVNLVVIFANGKQLAKDSKAPYTAVLSKPAPGQYAIQSVAYNIYGDTKISPSILITVK